MKRNWLGLMAGCAAITALAGGCDALERNPSRPGAGGIGGQSNPGDPGGGGGGGDDVDGFVTGRVCVLVDLRDPTSCNSLIDVTGYQVADRVTGERVVTDDLGDFALPTTARDRVDLVVTTAAADREILRTIVPIPLADGVAEGVFVPVFEAQLFENLLLDLPIAVEPEIGTASLVVHLFDDLEPAPLVDLRDPIGVAGVFYDDEVDPAGWAATGVTGGFGAILTPGVDPVPSTLLLGRGAEVLQVPNIPLDPDTLTIVAVDFGG